MTQRQNLAVIIAVGVLGVLAGFALIFANQPVGKAIVIVSVIGAMLAYGANRGPRR